MATELGQRALPEHQRQRSEHLGAIAERAGHQLERVVDDRLGVADQRVPDAAQ